MSHQAVRVFNHDLLRNEGDRESLRIAFPNAASIFDWPGLRAAFAPHDEIANQAKAHSRRSGLRALAVALAALWLAALEGPIHELVPGRTTTVVFTITVASLGFAGLLLASRVLSGARKERWLHHRAATERLRQLHFQFIVQRARAFASCEPETVAATFAERERHLEIVRRALEPGMSRPVETIMEDMGGAQCWMVAPSVEDTGGPIQDSVLESILEAYAMLRLRHQADYAGKKLASGEGFWPWEPQGQARRIGQAAFALTVTVVLSSALAVAVVALDPPGSGWITTTTEVIGTLAAMAALALRVLDDGMRPGREVARMRTYRGEILELLGKFEGTRDATKRLALGERMEELSYRELRDFLALHDEASFVL